MCVQAVSGTGEWLITAGIEQAIRLQFVTAGVTLLVEGGDV
jgi:hypothetical protein